MFACWVLLALSDLRTARRAPGSCSCSPPPSALRCSRRASASAFSGASGRPTNGCRAWWTRPTVRTGRRAGVRGPKPPGLAHAPEPLSGRQCSAGPLRPGPVRRAAGCESGRHVGQRDLPGCVPDGERRDRPGLPGAILRLRRRPALRGETQGAAPACAPRAGRRPAEHAAADLEKPSCPSLSLDRPVLLGSRDAAQWVGAQPERLPGSLLGIAHGLTFAAVSYMFLARTRKARRVASGLGILVGATGGSCCSRCSPLLPCCPSYRSRTPWRSACFISTNRKTRSRPASRPGERAPEGSSITRCSGGDRGTTSCCSDAHVSGFGSRMDFHGPCAQRAGGRACDKGPARSARLPRPLDARVPCRVRAAKGADPGERVLVVFVGAALTALFVQRASAPDNVGRFPVHHPLFAFAVNLERGGRDPAPAAGRGTRLRAPVAAAAGMLGRLAGRTGVRVLLAAGASVWRGPVCSRTRRSGRPRAPAIARSSAQRIPPRLPAGPGSGSSRPSPTSSRSPTFPDCFSSNTSQPLRGPSQPRPRRSGALARAGGRRAEAAVESEPRTGGSAWRWPGSTGAWHLPSRVPGRGEASYRRREAPGAQSTGGVVVDRLRGGG